MATIGKSVPTLLVHYHVFEIYRRMRDIDGRGGRHMRVRGRDLAQGAQRDDTEQARRGKEPWKRRECGQSRDRAIVRDVVAHHAEHSP